MSGRVVVTGSSGYLGAAVVGHLRSVGHDVVGIDRRPSNTTSIVGDVATVDVERALDGASAVVHAAALHAPHVGRRPDAEFNAVNVVATDRLLDAVARCRVPRFVFASTTSVYGHALVPDDRAVWVDEALPPEPRDVYDATKLEAEALVAARAGTALATVTLRIARCCAACAPRSTSSRVVDGRLSRRRGRGYRGRAR